MPINQPILNNNYLKSTLEKYNYQFHLINKKLLACAYKSGSALFLPWRLRLL